MLTCAKFLVRNTLVFLWMPRIQLVERSGIKVEGAKWKDIRVIRKMYSRWNGDKKLGLCKTIYLILFGRKVCVVARRGRLKAGYILFYVNRRDVRDGTVHEAFIVVSEEERGKGVATLLREISGSHYGPCGVSGISSRIYQENTPSMRSAVKAGFKRKETIFDAREQKNQAYLIWKF